MFSIAMEEDTHKLMGGPSVFQLEGTTPLGGTTPCESPLKGNIEFNVVYGFSHARRNNLHGHLGI